MLAFRYKLHYLAYNLLFYWSTVKLENLSHSFNCVDYSTITLIDCERFNTLPGFCFGLIVSVWLKTNCCAGWFSESKKERMCVRERERQRLKSEIALIGNLGDLIIAETNSRKKEHARYCHSKDTKFVGLTGCENPIGQNFTFRE